MRYDHVLKWAIPWKRLPNPLSSTIPQGGTLYTADSRAAALFRENAGKKTAVLSFVPPESVAQENISIARGGCRVPWESQAKNLTGAFPPSGEDFGTRRIYRMKNRNGEVFHFLNLFQPTIHNPQRITWTTPGMATAICTFSTITGEDRPDRALLFARYFFPHYKEHTVFLTGKGAFLPKRLFSGAGLTDLRGNSRLQGLP